MAIATGCGPSTADLGGINGLTLNLARLTWEVRTVGVMASGGSGRLISTFVAEERSLNCDRAFTRYSVRLRLCFSTVHSTQMSGFTFWLSRYVLQWRPTS